MSMRPGHWMRLAWLASTVALAWIGPATAAPPKIISTLEGYNEGWRVGSLPLQHTAKAPASHEATYDDAFGDPKGSLRVLDEAQETAIFAPVDFLGDKSAYYGGKLFYGIVVRASDGTNYGEAVLRSEAQSLFYMGDTIPTVSQTEFEYRTIPLHAHGWHVGSFDGPLATRDEMIAVLRQLTGLYIRTEWKLGPDNTSVDNIQMLNGSATSEVNFEQTVVTRQESAAAARLQLTRTGTFNGAASVDVVAVGGTATAGADYPAFTKTVHWAAGAGGTRSVLIPLSDDTIDENTETLLVGLANANNVNIGDDDQATIRIRDDDIPAIVSADKPTRTVVEGATTKVRVVLNTASERKITVPFTIQYGTASGADIVSVTPSPLVFTPGKLGLDIVIVTRTDALAEGDETLTVQLGAPTNALLGAQSSTAVTITPPP